MNPASSTTKAATLAATIMIAVWATFNLFALPALGMVLDAAVSAWESTVTAAVVGLAAYFQPENVYPNGAPWREGAPPAPPPTPEDKQ